MKPIEKLQKLVEKQPNKKLFLSDGSRFEIACKHAGEKLLYFTSWNYMFNIKDHFTEKEIERIINKHNKSG